MSATPPQPDPIKETEILETHKDKGYCEVRERVPEHTVTNKITLAQATAHLASLNEQADRIAVKKIGAQAIIDALK